jgi:hypothetical protein
MISMDNNEIPENKKTGRSLSCKDRKNKIKICCSVRDYIVYININGLPLWSSGQSSWLQIRRPGFDSRHYQKKKVVGL